MKRKQINLLPAVDCHITSDEMEIIAAYRQLDGDTQAYFHEHIHDCAQSPLHRRQQPALSLIRNKSTDPTTR